MSSIHSALDDTHVCWSRVHTHGFNIVAKLLQQCWVTVQCVGINIMAVLKYLVVMIHLEIRTVYITAPWQPSKPFWQHTTKSLSLSLHIQCKVLSSIWQCNSSSFILYDLFFVVIYNIYPLFRSWLYSTTSIPLNFLTPPITTQS